MRVKNEHDPVSGTQRKQKTQDMPETWPRMPRDGWAAELLRPLWISWRSECHDALMRPTSIISVSTLLDDSTQAQVLDSVETMHQL